MRFRFVFVAAVILTACAGVSPGDRSGSGSLSLLERQRMCADVGRYIQSLQISENMQRQWQAIDPEFAYNEPLNLCVFFGGYFDRSTGTTRYVLKDSLTNRILASYSRHERLGPGQTDEEREFLRKKAELMGTPVSGPLPKAD